MLTAANVVCRMIGHAEDVGFDAHEKFVRNVVAENVSLVATDEASQYRHLTKAGLPHDKPLFTKYLSEALEGVASTSFGFRQPSCRVYNDTVGIVNAYDTFMGATKDGRPLTIHGRTTLVFIKQGGQWKIVTAHFSAMPHTAT